MAAIESVDCDILYYIRIVAGSDYDTSAAILHYLKIMFGAGCVNQDDVDALVRSAKEGKMSPLELVRSAFDAFC